MQVEAALARARPAPPASALAQVVGAPVVWMLMAPAARLQLPTPMVLTLAAAPELGQGQQAAAWRRMQAASAATAPLMGRRPPSGTRPGRAPSRTSGLQHQQQAQELQHRPPPPLPLLVHQQSRLHRRQLRLLQHPPAHRRPMLRLPQPQPSSPPPQRPASCRPAPWTCPQCWLPTPACPTLRRPQAAPRPWPTPWPGRARAPLRRRRRHSKGWGCRGEARSRLQPLRLRTLPLQLQRPHPQAMLRLQLARRRRRPQDRLLAAALRLLEVPHRLHPRLQALAVLTMRPRPRSLWARTRRCWRCCAPYSSSASPPSTRRASQPRQRAGSSARRATRLQATR